jgi:hypothetical protein
MNRELLKNGKRIPFTKMNGSIKKKVKLQTLRFTSNTTSHAKASAHKSEKTKSAYVYKENDSRVHNDPNFDSMPYVY